MKKYITAILATLFISGCHPSGGKCHCPKCRYDYYKEQLRQLEECEPQSYRYPDHLRLENSHRTRPR